MNKDAGRGGLLIVTVRLTDGEKLPLVVDTGSPLTAFDKSLEPKLGKRLDAGTLWNFGVAQDVGVYAPPKLYLGNILLQMAHTNVATFDRPKLADHGWFPFMGFLGMDVLHNYCLQLDFAAGKLRFLDDEHADNSVTLDGQKKDDSSFYHYTVTCTSKRGPWKLQKAWRTDANGKMLEEFPVR